MAAITRRALEEEFDAVGEEGHACEAEMEECVGGAYGPDDDVDAQRLSSGMDQFGRFESEEARAGSLGWFESGGATGGLRGAAVPSSKLNATPTPIPR